MTQSDKHQSCDQTSWKCGYIFKSYMIRKSSEIDIYYTKEISAQFHMSLDITNEILCHWNPIISMTSNTPCH